MPLRSWLNPIRHAAARLADLLGPPVIGQTIIPGTAGGGPIPLPATPHPRELPVDTAIYGASGTPILSGFVTDLQEYNPDLRGRYALPIYEKMRRSDADVAAVLGACKLPIRYSGEFEIVPGAKPNEPDFAFAKEIAEFVRECLFEDLEYENASGVRFSQSWDSVMENALLCLDFGCSGSEDIWVIDGDRVRLRRIAPRLPLTFYQFFVDADGETLEAVGQWGYRGGQWVTANVPASKFTLFSYGIEGANFYGKALALDTPIPTPRGWRALGLLRTGDPVFDETGSTRYIRAKSEVWTNRPCYRVEFRDGSSIVADENHEWLVHNKKERDQQKPPAIRPTKELTIDCLLPNGPSLVANYIKAVIPVENQDTVCIEVDSPSHLFLAGHAGVPTHNSLLRSAYQHWYVKYNLYRIDAIACERNGAGVPLITMGESPSKEDKEYAVQWVEDLATHESTGLTLPFGWDLTLKGVEGQPRDLAPSIQHHSEMICRSALAMFMALGTTATGSRALGNTMVDFFQLAETAIANFICSTITETTIRRLVDFNYSPSGNGSGSPSSPNELPYPRLVIPAIAVLNPLDIITALKDVADAKVDIIQPDNETEEWLRAKLGMPHKHDPRPRSPTTSGPAPATFHARELEGRRKWHGLDISIETAAGSIRRGEDADGQAWAVRMEYPYGYIRRSEGADGEHVDCYLGPDPNAEFVYVIHQHLGGDYDEDKAMLDFPDAVAARTAYEKHAPHAPFHAMTTLPVEAFLDKVKATWDKPGKITAADRTRRRPTRDLRSEEQKHNFDGHCARADKTQTAIRRVLGSLKGQLFREAARRLSALAPANADQFAMPFSREVVGRVARCLELAYRYGYDQVYAERYRATARPKSERRHLAEKAKRLSRPGAIAETAVSDLNNGLTVRSRAAHVDAWKQGLRDAELEEAILEDLAEASDGWLDRIAMEAARAAVAGGRSSAFEELQAEIVKYVRSEAMDQNTCEPCAAGDGQEWDSLEDVDWVPGDDCEGHDACRGQLMPVFEDEGQTILE